MLPYGRQTIDEDDIAAVVDALRAPLLTCGPLVARFESALAARVGAPYASACSSGTAALHLAYAALGIGDGDEIITTPITFSATAAAAYYVGAKVRIADVDPRTGNLDPASVEALITPRTRAIVPVHLAGHARRPRRARRAIAQRHGLRVIEDACHALGATLPRRADRRRRQRRGRVQLPPGQAHHHRRGRRGRSRAIARRRSAASIACASTASSATRALERRRPVGLRGRRSSAGTTGSPISRARSASSQLAKLDAFVARRRELAAQYRAELAARLRRSASPPPSSPIASSAYHLFAVAIDFERFGTTRAARHGRSSPPPASARRSTTSRSSTTRCTPRAVPASSPGRAPAPLATTLARSACPLFPAMTDDDVIRVVGELHRVLGDQP